MSAFEDTKAKALTMLYLQNQDLSNLTPEELVDKFDKVHAQIKKYNSQKNPVKCKTFN